MVKVKPKTIDWFTWSKRNSGGDAVICTEKLFRRKRQRTQRDAEFNKKRKKSNKVSQNLTSMVSENVTYDKWSSYKKSKINCLRWSNCSK